MALNKNNHYCTGECQRKQKKKVRNTNKVSFEKGKTFKQKITTVKSNV